MLGRGIIATGGQYPDEEGIDFKLGQDNIIGRVDQKINRAIGGRDAFGNDMGNLAATWITIGKNAATLDLLRVIVSGTIFSLHMDMVEPIG